MAASAGFQVTSERDTAKAQIAAVKYELESERSRALKASDAQRAKLESTQAQVWPVDPLPARLQLSSQAAISRLMGDVALQIIELGRQLHLHTSLRQHSR